MKPDANLELTAKWSAQTKVLQLPLLRDKTTICEVTLLINSQSIATGTPKRKVEVTQFFYHNQISDVKEGLSKNRKNSAQTTIVISIFKCLSE